MKKHLNSTSSTATSQYLVTHQFISERGDQLQSQESLTDMKVAVMVQGRSSLSQSISLSNHNLEPDACERLYGKFLNLTQDQPQLRPVLLPVFAHLCLQLVLAGHGSTAIRFFEHCAASVGKGSDEKKVLSSLKNSSWSPGMQAEGILQELWENKYTVDLDNQAHQSLIEFLSQSDNGIISDIVNRFVQFRIDKPEQITTNKSPIKTKSLPPSIPPVAVHTLHGSAVCNMAVCSTDNRIACCLEDSSILLYPPARTKALHSVSHVPLAAGLESDVKSGQASTGCGILRGHSGSVYSAAFLDQILLSCSADHTVGCWNTNDGSLMTLYKGHNHSVWDIAVNEANSTFVTCSEDRTARLWITENAFPLRTFVGHLEGVDNIAMHTNGQYIATGSSDGCVRLWSTSDANSVRLFVHHSPISALCFSPDGQILATAAADKTIRLWDLASGKSQHKVETSSSRITSLDYNCQNSLLVSSALDGIMAFYDVRPDTLTESQAFTTIGQLSLVPVNLHKAVFTKGNFVLAAGATSGR